jgi:hypothetical protein
LSMLLSFSLVEKKIFSKNSLRLSSSMYRTRRCRCAGCRNHGNVSGYCRIHRSMHATNSFIEANWFACERCTYQRKTQFLRIGRDQARRHAINARIAASRFVRAVPSMPHDCYEKYKYLGIPTEYRGETMHGFCEGCEGYASCSWDGWV